MVSAPVILAVALAGVALGALLGLLRRKNVDLIVRARLARRPERPDGTCHLFVSVADHFEPYWHRADHAGALERAQAWHHEYPQRMEGIRDNGGRAPRHAFFYPEEEYDERCMDLLADLEQRGLGVVEVHLHHDNDTSSALHERLSVFKKVLYERHGLLRADPDTGEVRYAFIHGNWTLDNSGPRGEHCGVNDELRRHLLYPLKRFYHEIDVEQIGVGSTYVESLRYKPCANDMGEQQGQYGQPQDNAKYLARRHSQTTAFDETP
jgi:hypothetical protein